MQLLNKTTIFASVLALGLAGCTTVDEKAAATAEAVDKVVILTDGNGIEEPMPTRMVGNDSTGEPNVEGFDTYDVIVAAEPKARSVIQAMGPSTETDMADLIDDIRAGGGSNPMVRSKALVGVGGIMGHALLDAGSQKLDSRIWRPNWGVTVSAKGQITEYKYLDTDGYGKLTNIVTLTYTRTKPGGPSVSFDKAYKIRVKVAGGFKAQPRQSTGNAFPNTGLFIPQAKAGPFQWKIYARGQDIEIDEVWVDRTGNGFQASERIEAGSTASWKQGYKFLLETSDDDCVDMMVMPHNGNTPAVPMTKAELISGLIEIDGKKRLPYCLGRCQGPPLLNTK